MPNIGDIKQGKDIGKKDGGGYPYFVWASCPICRKERWVRLIKGKPAHNLCKRCSNKQPLGEAQKQWLRANFSGEKHPLWKGGRSKSGNYILVYLSPNDFFAPMAIKGNRVLEHRLVMAKHLNRWLLPWEIVHHKNNKGDDNRIENLELLPTRKYHLQDTVIKQYIKRLQDENRALKIELKDITDYADKFLSYILKIEGTDKRCNEPTDKEKEMAEGYKIISYKIRSQTEDETWNEEQSPEAGKVPLQDEPKTVVELSEKAAGNLNAAQTNAFVLKIQDALELV